MLTYNTDGIILPSQTLKICSIKTICNIDMTFSPFDSSKVLVSFFYSRDRLSGDVVTSKVSSCSFVITPRFVYTFLSLSLACIQLVITYRPMSTKGLLLLLLFLLLHIYKQTNMCLNDECSFSLVYSREETLVTSVRRAIWKFQNLVQVCAETLLPTLVSQKLRMIRIQIIRS
jgi:hypothetical protein